MSKVSKLVIKAYKDNKFSSHKGDFMVSINPEDLRIESVIAYNISQGMLGSVATSPKYCGSPPKVLSFSLLLDNTGLIPGSSTVPIIEQIKQLKDVVYNTHNKNNEPNYLRVIWGQIDFKGRLLKFHKNYTTFQADGTLARVDVAISVLEEVITSGKGKSEAGVDSNYTKPSGANATASRGAIAGQGAPGKDLDAPYDKTVGAPSASQESFAPTPNGMHGPYSGAPPGAYDGGADQVYHGSNSTGGAVYGASGAGPAPSPNPTPSARTSSAGQYDAGDNTGGAASYGAKTDAGRAKGGVAGNGPGGSGPGIGGGGHGPASNSNTTTGRMDSPAGKSGTGGASHAAGKGTPGATKGNAASGPASNQAKGKSNGLKTGSIAAASAVGGVAAAAAANGADSLRKAANLKAKLSLMKDKISFWRRIKNFAKKVAPKAYNAGKKVVKKI